MTTLDDVLQIQKQYHILQAPTIKEKTAEVSIASTPSTLNITIKNNTTSSNCWAYVTGLDLNQNNAVFILRNDGVTPYYPTSPSAVGSSLQQNCHIPLGAPGTSKVVTIPQIAGGRIWLARDAQLTFKLNPGPAVVEPSVTNPSDANYNLFWSFAEFTYNSSQLFANISYVDFVGLPIALTLENSSGAIQSVPGIPSDGLDQVCSLLTQQDAKDNAGWSKLIVKAPSGANLRALSPNSGIVMNNSLFKGYYQSYVNAVWAKYASTPLTVDTQNTWGVVTGTVSSSNLTFPNVGSFPQPSAADIFSCSSGAFAGYANNTDEMGNITARLAAAFNRSTLLINTFQPAKETVSRYYVSDGVTNHYSRIVHQVCPDGKGYAFPYDDVAADDADNVAGTVSAGDPKTFTVSFGGLTTTTKRVVHVSEFARSGGGGRQQVGGRRIGRRGLEWSTAEEEKALIAGREEDVPKMEMVEFSGQGDLEKGLFRRRELDVVPEEQTAMRSLESFLPAAMRGKVAALMGRVENSPAYRYAAPAVDALLKAVVAFLQLSVKSLVSRVVVVAFLLLCSFLLGFLGKFEHFSEHLSDA
jgi:hypothetical protein